jgi:hypothetical protein
MAAKENVYKKYLYDYGFGKATLTSTSFPGSFLRLAPF